MQAEKDPVELSAALNKETSSLEPSPHAVEPDEEKKEKAGSPRDYFVSRSAAAPTSLTILADLPVRDDS